MRPSTIFFTWNELRRWLMAPVPSKQFNALRDHGGLKHRLPELHRLWGVPQNPIHHPEVDTGVHVMMAIDRCAQADYSDAVRYATLVHDLGKGVTPEDILPAHRGHEEAGIPLVRAVNERLEVPEPIGKLALLVCEYHLRVHRIESETPASVVSLLKQLDYFSHPHILTQVLQACEADAKGRLGREDVVYTSTAYFDKITRAVNSIDVQSIIDANPKPHVLEQKLHMARVRAVRGVIRV